ncbi:galactose oxidase [Lactarius sanguifluus]|nr:galactose oxidase [Lactarius sanguifluus]
MSSENVTTTPRPSTPPSPLTFSPVGSESMASIPAMALSGVHSRAVSRDSFRRAISTHGSPAPLRDISLPGPDDRSLTPPVSAITNVVHAPRSASSPVPYSSTSASSLGSSTPTLRASGSSSRPPRQQSAPSRSTTGDSPTNGSTRRLHTPGPNASSTSLSAAAREAPASAKPARAPVQEPTPRFRAVPHLPNTTTIEPAPPPVMYWSKAPVWGILPSHGFRAHSVTLADNVAWIFGGCDDKGCFKDMWCFNIETMQWSHPEMQGDLPPPCRAHSATLIGRKIVIIGGGEGASYYNSVHVFDIPTRRWSRPTFTTTDVPPPRRAHTTVMYQGKIWVFGGGNGLQALNDVWTLDVGTSLDRMKWEQVAITGRKRPSPRGYHTANLVQNMMIVVGGSDGRECFQDIWCLNLDAAVWTQVKPDTLHRRLSHSAAQVGSYLFISGGHDGSEYTPELLLFNLVSLQYEPRARLGRAPTPRGYHASLLADSRLFIFGGFNGHDVFDDVHILDLAAAAYLPQVTSFSIDAQ